MCPHFSNFYFSVFNFIKSRKFLSLNSLLSFSLFYSYFFYLFFLFFFFIHLFFFLLLFIITFFNLFLFLLFLYLIYFVPFFVSYASFLSFFFAGLGRTDSTSVEKKWKALRNQEKYYKKKLNIDLKMFREKLDLKNNSWNGAVTGYLYDK